MVLIKMEKTALAQDLSEKTKTPSSDSPVHIFISYRRSEASPIANWLRQKIEGFEFPKQLSQFKRKLSVFLDTSFDKPTHDFWETNLRPKLQRANFLMVVLTPSLISENQPASKDWVIKEIETFIAHKKEEGVFNPNQIILVSAPSANGLGVPEILQPYSDNWNPITLSDFSWKRILPFETKAELDASLARIVATLADIPSDHIPMITQESERVRASKARKLTMGAITLAAIMGGLTLWAGYQTLEAGKQRDLAYSGESIALSLSAQQAAKDNVPALAASLALDVLPSNDPNRKDADRPFVWQANVALGLAYQQLYQRKFYKDPGEVSGVEWDDVNKRLFSISKDGIIQIRTLDNDEDTRSIDLGFDSPNSEKEVTGFLYRKNNGDLVISDNQGNLYSYSLKSDSKEVVNVSDGSIGCLKQAFDERLIVTVEGEPVRIFNEITSAAPKPNLVIDLEKHMYTWCADLTSDGKLVVAGTDVDFENGYLGVFSEKGEKLTHQTYPEDYLIWIDLARNDSHVVYASIEGKVHIQRVQDLLNDDDSSSQMFDVSPNIVNKAFFTPSSDRVVAGDNLGKLYIWDVNKQAKIAEISEQSELITDLSLTDDGFAASSADETVRIYDYAPRVEKQSLGQLKKESIAVATSDDGVLAAFGTFAGELAVWSLAKGELLKQHIAHSDESNELSIVRDIAFSANNNFLISVGDDGNAFYWEINSDKAPISLAYNSDGFSAVEIIEDAQKAILSSYNGELLWVDLQDVYSENIVFENILPARTNKQISDIDIDANENYLLIVYKDGSSEIREIKNNFSKHMELASNKNDNPDNLNNLVGIIDPLARWVVMGHSDSMARVYDIKSGSLLRELKHSVVADDVLKFDASGRWLLTYSSGNILVWDSKEDRELVLDDALVIADGDFIGEGADASVATVAQSGEIRLWDLTTGNPYIYYKDPSAVSSTYYQITVVEELNSLLLGGTSRPSMWPILPNYPELVTLVRRSLSQDDSKQIMKQGLERFYINPTVPEKN